MTNSTTEEKSGDGDLQVGPSAEELFGEIADESDGELTDRLEGESGRTDEIEDQTAADVFQQLQSEAEEPVSAESVLADETPEDIIRQADEPDEEPTLDDDLFDAEAFEDLLLTGRRKEDEFLWVETDDSESVDARMDADFDASETVVQGESTSDTAQENGGSEPAVDADSKPTDSTLATDHTDQEEPATSTSDERQASFLRGGKSTTVTTEAAEDDVDAAVRKLADVRQASAEPDRGSTESDAGEESAEPIEPTERAEPIEPTGVGDELDDGGDESSDATEPDNETESGSAGDGPGDQTDPSTITADFSLASEANDELVPPSANDTDSTEGDSTGRPADADAESVEAALDESAQDGGETGDGEAAATDRAVEVDDGGATEGDAETSSETALVPAEDDDSSESPGFFGWLRSKFGGIF